MCWNQRCVPVYMGMRWVWYGPQRSSRKTFILRELGRHAVLFHPMAFLPVPSSTTTIPQPLIWDFWKVKVTSSTNNSMKQLVAGNFPTIWVFSQETLWSVPLAAFPPTQQFFWQGEHAFILPSFPNQGSPTYWHTLKKSCTHWQWASKSRTAVSNNGQEICPLIRQLAS